jgi:hypothetical protein
VQAWIFSSTILSKYTALRDHSTQNHRGDSKDDNESQGGRLYVMPSNPLCPVTLRNYQPVAWVLYQRVIDQSKADIFI